MQLTVTPYHKSLFPMGGILIKGKLVASWLEQIGHMELSLDSINVYPIPGAIANTIWGCLVTARSGEVVRAENIGSNVYCQHLPGQLYIPANSRLHPQLSAAELDKMLKGLPHLFHPETGWVELPDPIRWQQLLMLPEAIHRTVTTPAETVFIPSRATAFYKQSIPPEEVLANLEEQLFPGRKTDNKPLSFREKIKLRLLRALFGSSMKQERKEPPGWFSRLLSKMKLKWADKLQRDLDDLEERNNREVDKLLNLFKRDPFEALKYAIPLDNDGLSRGSGASSYMLSRLWSNLAEFGSLLDSLGFRGSGTTGGGSGNGGGSIRLGRSYIDRLNQEYRNTAHTLIKNKEYQQAAFVYLKLLKDYFSGADTLEKGGFYAEAASIYLKYLNNKVKAAECYEKGQMPLQAIELYKELQRDEKVGDLYLSIGKKEEARPWFQKVVQQYIRNHQYIKAASIIRDKLEEPGEAQTALLEGWRRDKDAVNCLNWYFSMIEDQHRHMREIQVLYDTETTAQNQEKYLQVLKQQFDRYDSSQETIRDIAYAIVATKIKTDPFIASELQAFNKKDKRLLKDILIYRQQTR